jgi:hypothetical protein
MVSQANTKAPTKVDAYRAARLQAQGDPLTAAAQRLANAVPFLPELGAAWSAGLRSAEDLSVGRRADLAGRWNQARAEQQGYADEFQRDHPLVGNLLGALGMASPAAIASTALASRGAAQAAREVRPTSPGAGGLASSLRRAPGVVGQHAASGALVGAAYGFSRPGTLDQRMTNARNAFAPGAVGGALGPLALGGLGRAAAALERTPALAAAVQRSLSGAPLARTLNDLRTATGVDVDAALGDPTSLARSLAENSRGAWSDVNELPAPAATNAILEDPDVIHKYGTVMMDMEDEDRNPMREIPVANDYYSPIRGNLIPDFLLQLPKVEAVDATRRQLLSDVWHRYGASGRLELDPDGESTLGKAKALADLMSEGPDYTGQAYRRAFGGGGDELSVRGAFQSAQGKLLDPSSDPDAYSAWFGSLHPFEQQAARAAAANDILHAVRVGRPDVFASAPVHQRMQTAFGADAAAELLRNLDLENLATSLRMPGASGVGGQVGGLTLDPRAPAELDATPRISAPNFVPQATPPSALLPSPLAAWAAQQAQNKP